MVAPSFPSTAADHRSRNTKANIFHSSIDTRTRPMRRHNILVERPPAAPSSRTAQEMITDSVGMDNHRVASVAAQLSRSRNSISNVFSNDDAPRHRPLRTPQTAIVNEKVVPPSTRSNIEQKRDEVEQKAHATALQEAQDHRKKTYKSTVFSTDAAQPSRSLRVMKEHISAQRDKAPRPVRTVEQQAADIAVQQAHVASVAAAARARSAAGRSTVFGSPVVAPKMISPGKKMVGGPTPTIHLDHEAPISHRSTTEQAFDRAAQQSYTDATAVARQARSRNAGSIVLGGDIMLGRPATAPARVILRAPMVHPEVAMVNHAAVLSQAGRSRVQARGSGNILSWN